MKILLTGPTGFIGSAFARLALDRGHNVAGLVLPAETVPPALTQSKGFVALRGDLTQPPWSEVESFSPEVCIHTAWITTPGIYLESPENYKFLEQSLQFLNRVRALGTGHIVGLGTCIEYRMTGLPLSECQTPIEPTTVYSRCKNELRLKLEEAEAAEGFRFCWARVFYPYGPGEHPSRLCSSILGKLERNERVLLKTPGSTKDYIYIEDLAEALLTVVEARFAGTINLGTGIGVSVREIAGKLAELMGRKQLVGEAPNTDPDPLGHVVADVSRLRGLGWKQAHTIEQGLAELMRTKATAKTQA